MKGISKNTATILNNIDKMFINIINDTYENHEEYYNKSIKLINQIKTNHQYQLLKQQFLIMLEEKKNIIFDLFCKFKLDCVGDNIIIIFMLLNETNFIKNNPEYLDKKYIKDILCSLLNYIYIIKTKKFDDLMEFGFDVNYITDNEFKLLRDNINKKYTKYKNNIVNYLRNNDKNAYLEWRNNENGDNYIAYYYWVYYDEIDYDDDVNDDFIFNQLKKFYCLYHMRELLKTFNKY